MEHKLHVIAEMLRNGWTWYFVGMFMIVAIIYYFGGRKK